jgi:catechol 1,2-dioxygenase
MQKIENSTGRRKFMQQVSLYAVAVSLPCLHSCVMNQGPIAKKCSTTDDILGPFYKAGSPFQENIIPAENTAAPLIVQGKVISNCDTLLQDAVVEIWNANDQGIYDSSNQFKFRGSYKTNPDGTYQFTTIIPGRYLNGATYRPSHIHFRITAPNHQELVSQIYFTDDPFIKSDSWASAEKAAQRILPIAKDKNGVDTIIFDVYLNS